ncbi:MAG TPA: hypothetical protein VHQ64_20170, partial [Pyrinomonadaceae bacterium]|nr:hypothetical protein [Pyrinomonadaceae bacterium]
MSAPNNRYNFLWAAFLFVVAVTTLIAAPFLNNVQSSIDPLPAVGQKPQPPAKRKPLQPDLPGTIDGAADPASIPDLIAFELFMRSIADYPSAA